MRSSMHRRLDVRMLSCVVVIAASGLTAAGCGGAAKPAAPGTPAHPLVASTPAPNDGRSNESQPAQANAQPGYRRLLERQASRPQSRFSPCNLVTPSRARAILGEALLAPVEAPQGPTCIYRSRSGRSFTTLAVQASSFAHFRSQLRRPVRFNVAGHTAYCSGQGAQAVYVPLSGGRVLSVGGPCRLARQFASTALHRLVR
jgi:hypothetical protein